MLTEIFSIGQQSALPLPKELLNKPLWQGVRYAELSIRPDGSLTVMPATAHEILSKEQLIAGYQAMAADKMREEEACSWTEALIDDVNS